MSPENELLHTTLLEQAGAYGKVIYLTSSTRIDSEHESQSLDQRDTDAQEVIPLPVPEE